MRYLYDFKLHVNKKKHKTLFKQNKFSKVQKEK